MTLVLPAGIEPTSTASETATLSIVLQERDTQQIENLINVPCLCRERISGRFAPPEPHTSIASPRPRGPRSFGGGRRPGPFPPSKLLATRFVRLTTNAPPSADQKLATSKPATKCPTSMNRKALISTMPKPNVIKMKGSVNTTNSGFRIAFKKLNTSTTTSSVVGSSHEMPRTTFVAIVTPSAKIDQRSSKCING